MNKYFPIGLVILIVAAGGWWYFSQSRMSAGEYVNTEYGISFSHPTNWQCKTQRTSSEAPDRHQTICDDGENSPTGSSAYYGNPLISIEVPVIRYAEGDRYRIRETTMTGRNSIAITKIVYGYGAPGTDDDGGRIEYVFNGSSNMQGFLVSSFIGTDDTYGSIEEAERILDPIVQSLTVQ